MVSGAILWIGGGRSSSSEVFSAVQHSDMRIGAYEIAILELLQRATYGRRTVDLSSQAFLENTSGRRHASFSQKNAS